MNNTLNVGFIGLGHMGSPMAARLIDAGFNLTVFDSSPKTLEEFVSRHGGRPAASVSGLGAGAHVVITMLPDGDVVRQVVLGNGQAANEQLLASMPKNSILIDMSSSSPTGTQTLGKQLAENGILMLDAPVSGGVSRAVTGTLAIMVGGEPAPVLRCMPLFTVMGNRIFETGPLGSGHSMKVLNNMVSAAGLIAAAEALLVGARFGLKPEIMIDVLNASTGRNNSTENKFNQFILSRTFNSGFSLDLMLKDLGTAMQLARDTGMPAPFSASCYEMWAKAREKLEKGVDHTAVVRWFEETVGMELSRKGKR